MFLDREAPLLGNLGLAVFDLGVKELFHVSTLQTDQMVMMGSLVEFKHGLAAFEMMTDQQAGLFKLGQHPVDGGQTDVHAFLLKTAVDFFRTQMAGVAGFKQGQHPEAGKGGFQSDVLEILGGAHIASRGGLELVHYKSIQVKGMIKRTVTMGMLTGAGLFLAGCSNWSWYSIPGVSYLKPYTLDIQQGVIIDSDMVARLKEGMTRAQVAYTLGTPLLKDPFHKDRWDYIYYVRENGRLSHPHDLTVYFKDDKMVRYATDYPVGAAAPSSDAPPAVPVADGAPAVPPAGSSPAPQQEAAPNPDGSAGGVAGTAKGGVIDAGKTGE